MRLLPASLAALGLLSLTLSAQDVLHYKFDAMGGNKVINYAKGTTQGPAEGTLMGTATAKQRWAPGKFGGSLMGGANQTSTARNNYVSSGWDGAFSGSFTVAWFMKEQSSPGATLSYIFSGIGSFRCFTNGVAATGLWLRAWGGVDLKLTTDIQALAKKGWTHIALVVNATTKRATWYINGVAGTPITIAANPNVAKGTSFSVGMHTATNLASTYDLDEFRFTRRAATATEVLVWSRAVSAADAPYGTGCGGTLSPLFAGAIPRLGQAKYGIKAQFKNPGVVAVMVGASRSTFLGVPNLLPLDLGGVFTALKGCMLENSMDLVVGKLAGGTGSLSIPLPIPNDKNLSGATLFCQCLLLLKGQEQTTNGWVISIR
jgi:Concanavalin A-like lectin/glucanases superfamily